MAYKDKYNETYNKGDFSSLQREKKIENVLITTLLQTTVDIDHVLFLS